MAFWKFLSDSSNSSGTESNSDSDYEPLGNESDSSTDSNLNSASSDGDVDDANDVEAYTILCPHTLLSML